VNLRGVTQRVGEGKRVPERLGAFYRCPQLIEGPIRITEHPGGQRQVVLACNAGMGTRPIRQLHVRTEHLEATPKVRKRRLEFAPEEQYLAERSVRPDQTGRVVKPFGHMQRLLGKMLGLLHLGSIQMVEHQAAECCEPPGVIPELLTELPGPRIGSANVGVPAELGRKQGWTKRHLQVQLALGPLVRIGQRFDQRQASAKLVDRFEVRRLPRRGRAGFVPVRNRLRRTVRFGVVVGDQLRLRARQLGKAILQQLCRPLVILLTGAF